MFDRDGVPFRIVVEPNEVKAYRPDFGDRLLVLPQNDRGLVYSRNWIKKHAVEEGHARHWQFDDDIDYFMRLYRGYRLECASNVALVTLEDFVDRYENVALGSFNSMFFMQSAHGVSRTKAPPFYLNARCYTCFLMLNSLPNKWRYRYNEDTDMSLQVLADGWCTVLFNVFLIFTKETMTQGGGQTPIYTEDGRLRMARQLERVWPGVVTTKRRFGRPQHVINGLWRKFDTPLKRRKNVDWSKLEGTTNEYGLVLKSTRNEIKSEELRKLLRDQ
jgi:hypothetical protein